MKLVYLGGAREVGASSILINLDGYKILLDCGIRQKKSKDKLPDFSQITSFGGIDAIIVSHAHMDHIGSLPIISKEYPGAKIYMNRMTMELSRVLLYDSLKIMNYQEGELPIFNEDDVLNMFERVVLVPFQQEKKIFGSLSLTFYMAGHIAGASAIYLKSKEGTIFYTGDYSLFSQYTVSGLSIPKLRPDIVISEATYGDRLHSNREIEELKLIDKVSEIINNGGKVLIPAFALGRSQEVLLILKKAFNKKMLKKVNVYVDGMIRNINNVFLNHPLYLKESLGKKILKGKEVFYDDNIIRVDDDNLRKNIVLSKEPCVIIASSGMLSGGMSEYYAGALVTNSKNGIILTGYQDEESNGSVLLNLLDEPSEKRILKLNGNICNVVCQIEKVGLSAHADKQEMKSLFSNLMPKSIILGHSDEMIIDKFASEVTGELNVNVYVPRVGDVLDLEIKNPRKQVDYKLEHLYSGNGEIEDFYKFIKDKYSDRLFTKEDLAYIYYGKSPSEEDISLLTNKLISSVYFTQDKRRYFLFKISDELDIVKESDKEITSQEIEEIIKTELCDFPIKKISYFLNENRVVLTFDFPRVISGDFDEKVKGIYDKTGIIIEKNSNINNLACENVIKSVLGIDNVDKISYLPVLDKFRVKVYDKLDEKVDEIVNTIGYDVELVLTNRVEKVAGPIFLTGEKLEQNEALNYIDNCFSDKKHKPYKKSFKNGNIVLSFISYEIGCLYLDEINMISRDINWVIELNRSANMNMIFSELDVLLEKHNFVKVKNPSYLVNENKVMVMLKDSSLLQVDDLKKEFLEITGLELIIK